MRRDRLVYAGYRALMQTEVSLAKRAIVALIDISTVPGAPAPRVLGLLGYMRRPIPGDEWKS